MWNYEKRLQYPVKITRTNPKMAQVIISQFGGPDGELAASMRYLSQRYTMPYKEVTGILTDIGTEEASRFRKKYNTKMVQYSVFPGLLTAPGIVLHLLSTAVEAVFFSGNGQCLITSHFSIILQIIPLPILFMPVVLKD